MNVIGKDTFLLAVDRVEAEILLSSLANWPGPFGVVKENELTEKERQRNTKLLEQAHGMAEQLQDFLMIENRKEEEQRWKHAKELSHL